MVHIRAITDTNESAQERQRSLDLFGSGRDPAWRNRLIWGDKKYVLPALLGEFAGKIELIYIDPPFDTGADFSFQVQVDGEEFIKEPSVIEQKAYRDTWGRGLDSYLQWTYETVLLLRELLTETGSIYIHLDWHAGHYVKAVLDELFGRDNFRNEIAWCYTGPGSPGMRQYNRKHDTIFWYSKGTAWRFEDHAIRERHDAKTLANFKAGLSGSGFIADTYELDSSGKIPEDWWPMAIAGRYPVDGVKRAGYPNEKPWPLIERIVAASSRSGDLVLDCFCGSGIFPAVAESLGRRWIAADLGRFAIHTTRKRLLSIPDVKPFAVQNLGKYERQLWQAAEFGDAAEARTLSYRRFILDLYRASPISGRIWLHGIKAGRMVHVGSVDAPVSPGDVGQIAAEFRRSIGSGSDAPVTNGVDVLGWDFAFELNEVAKQQAALANIGMRFVRIPREVLEKRAVEQGDIRFFELAALAVDLAAKGRSVILTLTDFVIPLDDVPEDVQRAITNWAQWIDYWAVDWDNKSDTFHNEDQTYRTRKNRDLKKSLDHTYSAAGTYSVVVKVIDILGNDTTKTLKVTVA